MPQEAEDGRGSKREPDCATCGDLGFVTVDEVVNLHPGVLTYATRYTDAVPCVDCADSRALKEANAVYRYTRLTPAQWERARFDMFDPAMQQDAALAARIRDMVVAWADRKMPPLFFLAGPIGVGKTHLATAAIRRVAERGEFGMYWSARDIAHAVRTFDDDRYGYDDIRSDLTLAPFLVIDDVGVELNSDWLQTVYHAVLDHRYQERMPTLVTSNADAPDIKARIGARSYDRFEETNVGQRRVFNSAGIESVRAKLPA